MGILRSDRITGLGGANAITGSAFFAEGKATTTSSDYNLGTGDFTIECFVYFSGKNPTLGTIFETRSSTTASDGFLLGRFQTSGHENKVELYTDLDYRVTADRTVENDTWVHIAVVRASATTKVYVDGTAYSSTYSDSNNYSNTEIIFGKNAPNSDTHQLRGFISNFHVVKGTAIYTANFTPPTNQIQKRSDTVFLGFQSASDVTHEETGKIITFPISGHDGVSHGPETSKGPISSRFTPNSPVGFSTTTDVGSQYGTTFDGFTVFATSTYLVPPGGNTRERNRGRALYAGGYKTPNTITAIDSIEIQSGGLTEQFGDLSTTQHANCSACSSSTRMVTNGGFGPSANNNIMEFVTIANSSNSTDFGDLAVGRRNNIAASNQTRGLVYGGNGSPANTAQVDFFTIATAGNAADFGDASSSTALSPAGGSSTTRALFAVASTPSASDTIDLFTIASTGDATDFGNLTSARLAPGGLSSSTRTVFGGGGQPSEVNTIDFVTTATTGNATDFGDLFLARSLCHGTSDQTRGIFMGGTTSPARQDTIDSIEIATTGNAVNWGDFRTAKQNGGVASDSHGGL
tara:strand:+ start:976 stop:2703 length:1728 start_codon:yes stop_codon:yes gene_type:complete